MITTLDGYIEDQNGDFQWGEPSEEVFARINELESNIGTMLLGRKMYDIMAVWDTYETNTTGEEDFARNWRAAKKIVYSTSLSDVITANTTIERKFDPAVVQKMVAESSKDFSIAGPQLTGQAIRAGIVDEFHQYVVPIIIGGGVHWLPKDVQYKLDLVDAQKFDNGFVLLQYRKA